MFRVVAALVLSADAATPPRAPEVQQPAAEHAGPQSPAAAEPEAAPEGTFASDAEKNSYAVGYDFGRMIRTRKLGIETEPLFAGLKDALAGGPGRLSENEVTVLVRGIHNESARLMQKERAELSARNRAEGTAFLEANRTRPGVVALPSGLQYEVLRPGDGPRPAADDSVKVHFRGTLLDGKVFDGSEGRGGPIVVRPSSVIPAWTEALPMMSVGAKWKLFVPADLGYGDRVADNLPPGSTLIFEVEIVSIEPKEKDVQAPQSPEP